MSSKIHDIYGKRMNKWAGERVTEQDWDNLVILDGCRFDVFRETNPITGDLATFRSAGSTSHEYFINNFDGESYPDIVYITANTWFHKINSEFHDIIPARELLWDDEIMTVLPSDLTQYVLNNKHKYRDKRVIIHYMQPHMPFLIEEEDRTRKSPLSCGSGLHRYSKEDQSEIDPWWIRLEEGIISRDEAWAAYKNTLKIALKHVHSLVKNMSGKTVISADHGNAFGENGIYGHPKYRTHPVLTKVPWLSIEGTRKNIKPGEDLVHTQTLSSVDKEKLRALGYIE